MRSFGERLCARILDKVARVIQPAIIMRSFRLEKSRAFRPRRGLDSPRHLRPAGGFSLLEVVVSIAILGGVITALLVARSSAQETHLIAAQMLTATRLAASRAALVRAGALGPGEGEIGEPSGYRWRITAIPPPEGGRKDVRMYDLSVWPEAHEAEAGVGLHVWILDRTVEAAP